MIRKIRNLILVAALVLGGCGGSASTPPSGELRGGSAIISLTVGAAFGVALTALAMASLARRVGTVTLLVVGLMLGFSAQGFVSVILHFANRVGGRVFSGWNDGGRYSRFSFSKRSV